MVGGGGGGRGNVVNIGRIRRSVSETVLAGEGDALVLVDFNSFEVLVNSITVPPVVVEASVDTFFLLLLFD